MHGIQWNGEEPNSFYNALCVHIGLPINQEHQAVTCMCSDSDILIVEQCGLGAMRVTVSMNMCKHACIRSFHLTDHVMYRRHCQRCQYMLMTTPCHKQTVTTVSTLNFFVICPSKGHCKSKMIISGTNTILLHCISAFNRYVHTCTCTYILHIYI